MAEKRKTLYEILDVSQNASVEDIREAYQRLSQELESGKTGLSREDTVMRRQVLKLALDTLSNQIDRDSYDGKLAHQASSSAVAPKSSTSLAVLGQDAQAAMLIAALGQAQAKSGSGDANLPNPMAIVATTVDKSVSSLWKILRIIGLALLLMIVIKVAAVLTAGGQGRPAGSPPSKMSKAEEKVWLQEYYRQHGVMPASIEEMNLLENERQRKLNEQRAAEVKRNRQEQSYEQFLEESRRRADEVSNRLRYEEAVAREQAEQEKRREEYRKQRADEAERQRIRASRQQLGLPGDPPGSWTDPNARRVDQED